MSGPLRELIARVVLRVDESALKKLDTQLDLVKSKLAGVQSAGKAGIKVSTDTSDVEKSLVGIRVALREMGSNVSPELSAKLREQLDAGRAKAEEVKAAIDKLRLLPDAKGEVEKLEKQLAGIEKEATRTAAALDKVDDGFRKAADEAKKLPGLLGKIQDGIGKLGPGLQAIGVGLSVTAIGAWVEGTLKAADAVGELSARLGAGTDDVQVWMAFASQAGASSEDLSASFKGLANQLQAVASGDKAAKAAFKELGIETTGWEKKLPPLGDTLALVGGKLAELDDQGKRVALTQKLLSEGGLKLAPGFRGGTEAVQEQIAKLKELAVVYDEDFIAQSKAANDELGMFKAQFGGLGSELILTFLPALRGAVTGLTPLIRGFRDVVKDSKLVSAGFAAAGLTGLASFGGVTGVITKLAPWFTRLARFAAPIIAAFAKFAIITLLLDDFFTMLNGGKSVLGELLGRFEAGRTILETFQMSFKGLRGAAMLLWGTLSGDQSVIDKGKALLDEFSEWVGGIVDNVKFAWNHLWNNDVPALIQSGLTAVDTYLRETFGGVYDFLKEWAGNIASLLGGIWDAALEGLTSLLTDAGSLLKGIPGVGSLFGDEAPEGGQGPKTSAANALDAGSPSSPFLPGGPGSNVTVNYDQRFETNIQTSSPKETLAAQQKAERNYTSTMKDNRKVLRHAVGATR